MAIATPNDGRRIAAFFAKVEQRLKLSQRNRLKFTTYKNRKKLLKVTLSKFWVDNEARRQLMTILLRSALRLYRKQSDFDRVFKARYLAKTKKAVNKFMEGKTALARRSLMVPYGSGWVEHFRYADNIEDLV